MPQNHRILSQSNLHSPSIDHAQVWFVDDVLGYLQSDRLGKVVDIVWVVGGMDEISRRQLVDLELAEALLKSERGVVHECLGPTTILEVRSPCVAPSE